MKRIYTVLSMLAVLTLSTVSCDLEKYPYSDIEQSIAFKSLKDATTLNNGLYAYLRANTYGAFMYTSDVQADLLNATLDYGNRNGQAHQWTSFLSDDYTIRDTWYGYYNALANVNNFIENAPRIPLATDTEKATLNKYLGEAYLMRAYYFHQLALRWAKDYEPATAAIDLGIPIVLKYSITEKPARSSVAETYAQIVADLNKAKDLLASVPGAKMSNRLTKDCALALEARVKLCMHDWTGAKTAADALISSNTYPLITTAADFKKMWAQDSGSEIIMQIFADKPSELGNANSIYLGQVAQTGKYTPDFVPQKWVIDLFSDSDIRKNAYLEKKQVYIQGTDYADIYLINKYPGNPSLYTTATTNYQHKPILFRIAEMYLISAEAAAQSVSTEPQALTILNTLRSSRGLVALTNLSGVALMNAVKEERVREMLCEGTRIEDLKRWKMGFSRSTPQNTDLIILGADFEKKSVLVNDDKFVWGLPKNDIATNPNLKQNQGW